MGVMKREEIKASQGSYDVSQNSKNARPSEWRSFPWLRGCKRVHTVTCELFHDLITCATKRSEKTSQSFDRRGNVP